jgi:hypothetical protein
MSSLRIARAAIRARPAAIARPLQRRGYAEVANDKIKLSLALPHQVRIPSNRDEHEYMISPELYWNMKADKLFAVHLQVTGCVRSPLARPTPKNEHAITDTI